MPKRKRDDDGSGEEDQALRIRKGRFRAKIEQGNRTIASALKLARGFERQKLGRRQKTSKNDPKELLRLKEEVIALKALDLGQTAEKYLFKQLAKTKRIKVSPTFVSIYGEDPTVEAPKPGAEANVIGRLFNSNPMKEAMPVVMKGIFNCLGLEDIPNPKKAPKSVDAKPSKQKLSSKAATIIVDEFEGFSPEDDEAELASHLRRPELNVGDVDIIDDDLMADYDDRITSDSSSDLESVSSGIVQTTTKPMNASRLSHNHDASISPSASPSPPPPPKLKPLSKATKPAPTPTGKTTFLPSLMMGGYYSGSESDDDRDGYVDPRKDKDPLQQRKNRRGQRARQAIAEKKHGKNAKHLKNEQAKETKGRSRDAGWDVRKGAIDGKDVRGKDKRVRYVNGRKVRERPRNDGKPTGANGEVVAGRRNVGTQKKEGRSDSGGPLHPSWEAAKKRKEQIQGTTGAFVGKKTTFD